MNDAIKIEKIDSFGKLLGTYGYVYKNNVLLFQKQFLSQWYGAFKGQESPIKWEIQTSPRDFETIVFNCAEQVMMASKASYFNDWETLNKILDEKNPKIQQQLGREVNGFDQDAWDKHKYNLILEINFEKFLYNKHLQDLMKLIPRHCLLAESTEDLVYGTGIDINDENASDVTKWTGENLLGYALMAVRNRIHKIV